MAIAIALSPPGVQLEVERRVASRTRELERELEEKSTLLKEVHHRVKNNLQVVCSLLSMQIGCADNDQVIGPLEDAYSRVLAMSLVHESIYQSGTLGDVNFAAYIESLAARLFNAYCVDAAHIRFETNLEPVRIALDQAIPCGLIINELVSNALKHAFPNGREGVIRISLRRAGRGPLALSISDNGVGIPADFRWQESRSLGLQIVHTLVAQLHADLEVTRQGGTTYCLRWKLPI
jgi:two-component sensor histidine kinase